MPDPDIAVAQRVLNYRSVVQGLTAKYGLDPALVLAQVQEESGGNPDAFPENPARDGASFGLLQVLLPTARSLGFTGSARLLFDPVISLTLGIQYLDSLVRQYKNPWLALVAYNGGPWGVMRYRIGFVRDTDVHYANTVWANRDYYRRRLADLEKPAAAPVR